MKEIVNVYIDGFNFYYGLKAKKWKKFYWLDIVKFYELFMGDNQELGIVYYFTAEPSDPGQFHRQNLFLTANKENPKFKVILGKFLKKQVTFGGRVYNTFEEKQTDVNLAVTLIRNQVLKHCNVSIIVSGDSDLSPVFELVKELDPKHRILSHFPPERQSLTLSKCATAIFHLERYERRFEKCLLPDKITLKNGIDIAIPPSWKAWHPKKK